MAHKIWNEVPADAAYRDEHDNVYSTEHIVSLHGDPVWQAIWNTIIEWDIGTPAYGGHCAANGDHVTQIYEAVARRCEICGPAMDK